MDIKATEQAEVIGKIKDILLTYDDSQKIARKQDKGEGKFRRARLLEIKPDPYSPVSIKCAHLIWGNEFICYQSDSEFLKPIVAQLNFAREAADKIKELERDHIEAIMLWGRRCDAAESKVAELEAALESSDKLLQAAYVKNAGNIGMKIAITDANTRIAELELDNRRLRDHQLLNLESAYASDITELEKQLKNWHGEIISEQRSSPTLHPASEPPLASIGKPATREVIVRIVNDAADVYYATAYYSHDHWLRWLIRNRGWTQIDQVTHWMEIPKLPPTPKRKRIVWLTKEQVQETAKDSLAGSLEECADKYYDLAMATVKELRELDGSFKFIWMEYIGARYCSLCIRFKNPRGSYDCHRCPMQKCTNYSTDSETLWGKLDAAAGIISNGDYTSASVAAFQTACRVMADKLHELWEAEREK